MTTSPRRIVPLLLAFVAVGTGLNAAEPGAPGARLYRGTWRDLAAEAAEMEKEAAQAVAARDDAAAFGAFHALAFLESDRQRFEPMLRAAETAVAIGQRWIAAGLKAADDPYRQRIFHLESRGLVEKGLAMQGRLAEGQAELRRMRAELTALHVAEHGGSAQSLAALGELDRWGEASLFLLWQVIEREALYLERAGRGHEAVPALRAAIDAARRSRTGERIDAFYEIQLAPRLAAKWSALGRDREAIAVLEEFLREWDSSRERFAEQYEGARVQLAMYRWEVEGPGEALLRDAEDAHRRLAAAYGGGHDHWSAGIVAFLRHRLRPDPASAAELRRLAAALREDGEILQSLSARADALALGNDFAQPGREPEFLALLAEVRRTVSKSSEPALYRNFGDYLLRLGRPAEALPRYREALRLVESFGWTALEPRYRLALIGALTRLGDVAAAEAEWAKLDRAVAAARDLPPERALDVQVARVRWHTQRGRTTEARAALAEAQTFARAHPLTAWQRRGLDGLTFDAPIAAAPPAAAARPLLRTAFDAVTFVHELRRREMRAGLENIRFTASAPVRLECYDAATGRLLAIDAEGNGRFTDPGDLLPEDADANLALDVPFAAGQQRRELEIFVFPAAAGGAAGKVHVDVELLGPGGWEPSARHELD